MTDAVPLFVSLSKARAHSAGGKRREAFAKQVNKEIGTNSLRQSQTVMQAEVEQNCTANN